MKKIMILAIVFFAFMNVCVFAYNDEFEAALKEYNKQVRVNSVKYKNCTPFKENGFIMYGVSNGMCHYAIGTTTYNGKTMPLTDCYAPMSVMQQYANDMVKNLKEDSISINYNSSTDVLNRYCKNTNTTIKVR